MTHDEATTTALKIASATMGRDKAAHQEAMRLTGLRSFTRRDKESLSDLVRRYPQALNTDRYRIKP